MGTHILDAFFITFGLDTRQFEEGERDITDRSKRLRDEQKRTFEDIERFGKKTGESIKGLSREVIGLGLAFMGARSITGLLTNIATGAASADRFGQIIGMSTEKVYAWRKAVSEIDPSGGEAAADSSLSAIQNAKMNYRMGALSPDEAGAYGRLGISGNDFRNADAGTILQKLAGAKNGMDPQLYASLLQQIGLPASTVSLLMQGKASVDQLIAKYEADTEGLKKAAEAQKNLQTALVELQSSISEGLVPVLANDILPALKTIADWIKTAAGGIEQPKDANEWGQRVASDLFTNKRNAWQNLYEYLGPESGSWIPDSWKKGGTGPSNGKTRADRNNNPGNIVDSAWTRKQAGYAGSDGRFARFSSPDHGFAAMEKLLGNYMAQGRTSISSILSKYAPSSENDVGAYARHVSKLTGLGINQTIGAEHIPLIARAMAKHEGYSFRTPQNVSGLSAMHRSFARNSAPGFGKGITIQNMTVHTQAKDGHALMRDVRSATNRRAAVVQSDRVVNP